MNAYDTFRRDLQTRFFVTGAMELCVSPAKPDDYTNDWYCQLFSHVHTILQCGFVSDWILVPEFANDRLHWHGYIKFKRGCDPEQFIKTELKTLVKLTKARTSISKIRNRSKYIDYILKEAECTLETLAKMSSDEHPGSLVGNVEQKNKPMNYLFFSHDHGLIHDWEEPSNESATVCCKTREEIETESMKINKWLHSFADFHAADHA